MNSLDIRNASLLDVLPDSIADDPEVLALSRALDPQIQGVSAAILDAIVWPRLAEQSEPVLDALAWGFRILEHEGWEGATLAQKRALMTQVVALYRRRGTVWAVRHALDLLGEVYTLTRWHETPPSAPWSYKLQILVSDAGLAAAQVARARELVESYGQITAWPEEISALLVAEPAATATVQAVSIGVDVTVAHV